MKYDLTGKRVLFPSFDSGNRGVILGCMQAGAFCILHDENHAGGSILARKTGGNGVGLIADLSDPEHVSRYLGAPGEDRCPDIVIMGRGCRQLPAAWHETSEDDQFAFMRSTLDHHFAIIENCVALMASCGRGILVNPSAMYWGYDQATSLMVRYANEICRRMDEVLARYPDTGFRAVTLLPGNVPTFRDAGLPDLTQTPYIVSKYAHAVLMYISGKAPLQNGDVILYSHELSLNLW